MYCVSIVKMSGLSVCTISRNGKRLCYVREATPQKAWEQARKMVRMARKCGGL